MHTHTCIFFYVFFSIMAYRRILNIVPCALQQDLVVYLSCIVVQLLSHVRLFAASQTAAGQASLSFTISWSLLKLMSIKATMPPNHLILCPFSSSLQSFPSSGSFPMSQLLALMAKVLVLQLQHQSFQRIFKVDFLSD